MVCLSPNVSEIATVTNGEAKPFNLSTEIQFDGFSTDFRDVPVVPDPVFDKFMDGVRVVKSDDLILTVSCIHHKRNYTMETGIVVEVLSFLLNLFSLTSLVMA